MAAEISPAIDYPEEAIKRNDWLSAHDTLEDSLEAHSQLIKENQAEHTANGLRSYIYMNTRADYFEDIINSMAED